MEGQYDFANLQRGLWELHHDDISHHEDLGKNNLQRGLWKFQRHQYDISYREYLVQNNRMKTEGGDKHRRAVRFHAGQRDNVYHICSEANDRETPGNAE